MAFTHEFVVDRVLVHDNYFGFQNAVKLIQAHWVIRHTEYPDGRAHHYFEIKFDLDDPGLDPETYVPISDVSDAVIEQWLTGDLTYTQINDINANAFPMIQRVHEIESLETWYENPDAPGIRLF